MKTHPFSKLIAAALLIGTAFLGSAAIAAPSHLKSLNAAEIHKITSSPAAVKAYLAANKLTASELAAEIGAAFKDNSALTSEAPAIVRVLLQAILSDGVTPQAQAEAGQVVATIVGMLPGTVQSNHSLIVAIATSAAGVVKATGGSPDLATAIVTDSTKEIKVSAGNTDVTSTVTDFIKPFQTEDSDFNRNLANIAANVLGQQPNNATNTVNAVTDTTQTSNQYNTGSITTQESKFR